MLLLYISYNGKNVTIREATCRLQHYLGYYLILRLKSTLKYC